jgi:hypothetical protein
MFGFEITSQSLTAVAVLVGFFVAAILVMKIPSLLASSSASGQPRTPPLPQLRTAVVTPVANPAAPVLIAPAAIAVADDREVLVRELIHLSDSLRERGLPDAERQTLINPILVKIVEAKETPAAVAKTY